MIFRRAVPPDFPDILELQRQNLLQNLEHQDLQEGFLSIEYSLEQLERLNRELGIFVARDNDRLAGYLIAQPMDFALQSPLISSMVRRFPDVHYKKRPLSELKIFIYGPVCIDRDFRGRGVLEGIYAVMLATVKGHYDAGVAFVSRKNPRSLYAHRDKLGMKVVDEFEFSGLKYDTLVFDCG